MCKNFSNSGELEVSLQNDGADGSASAPSYSFVSDTNTGMFRSGTDELAFSTNGTLAVKVDANQNLVVDSGEILNSAGSVGNPSYSFSGDTNTGVYRSAADTLSFSTGGVLAGSFTSAQKLSLSTALVLPTSGGTASDLNYYEDITLSAATVRDSGDTANFFNPSQQATFRVIRIGKLVTVHWDQFGGTLNASESMLVPGVIPARFRPAASIQQPVRVLPGTDQKLGLIVVDTSGNVKFFETVAAANSWGASPTVYAAGISYCVA